MGLAAAMVTDGAKATLIPSEISRASVSELTGGLLHTKWERTFTSFDRANSGRASSEQDVLTYMKEPQWVKNLAERHPTDATSVLDEVLSDRQPTRVRDVGVQLPMTAQRSPLTPEQEAAFNHYEQRILDSGIFDLPSDPLFRPSRDEVSVTLKTPADRSVLDRTWSAPRSDVPAPIADVLEATRDFRSQLDSIR